MISRMRYLILLAAVVVMAGPRGECAPDQDSTARTPKNRFASQIEAYLKEDSLGPPPRGGILFIGSSIFRLWTHLKDQMSPLPVLNRAFGGSRTEDVLEQMDRIVFPYEPKIIVYYCGSNDVNAGEPPLNIFLGFRQFAERVAKRLPATEVYYVSINRAPQKRGRWDVVDSANALARNYCMTTPRRAYIDVNPILFDAEGKPRLDLYVKDELHFRDQAYVEFAAKIKPLLEKAWSAMQRRIRGISHVALFAHDMESSLAFYSSFLGFEEQFRLERKGGGLDLTFLKINDRQWIELFPETGTRTDRLHQIAFEVVDAEGMRTYLASRGVKVPDTTKRGRIGNTGFHVTDPDGHIVEFVQYEEEGWTMRDRGKHLSGRGISTSLRHLGFTVRSIERSMAFYRDILGCQETWRGSSDGQRLSWVNLALPDADGYVEFMLYADPPTSLQRGTMNHFSLGVEDLTKVKEILDSRPARNEYHRSLEVRIGKNRKRQLNLYDPDSTRVELMELVTVDGVPAPSSTAPPPHVPPPQTIEP